jgi:hypothetical protein
MSQPAETASELTAQRTASADACSPVGFSETFMNPSQSATALTPHQFDEEAFAHLATHADTAKTAFQHNAIDRALDRLLLHPGRKTKGRRLAHRLERDARKHLRVNRRREFLSDSLDREDRHLPPSGLQVSDIAWAVATVEAGLRQLSQRDREVLAVKAGVASTVVGVQRRQLRNLVTAARQRLRQTPDAMLACEIIMDGLRRWRFAVIEFVAPLTVCLGSN